MSAAAVAAGYLSAFLPLAVAGVLGVVAAVVRWLRPGSGPRPRRLRAAWATLAAISGLQAALLYDAPALLAVAFLVTGLGVGLFGRRPRHGPGAALWLAWIVLGVLVPGSLGTALLTGSQLNGVCLD